MKLACQEDLLPGESLTEKLANAKKFGFAGVEVWGKNLWDNFNQYRDAFRQSGIACTTICSGNRGCMLDPDPRQRGLAIGDIRKLLAMANELGAVGVVFVPIFGRPRLPDLTPLTDTLSLEKDLLVACLKELFSPAPSSKSLLLIEPLNRYETHFIKCLRGAVGICERLDDPRVSIMADFFHMGIEESNVSAAIKQAGSFIKHVHLADNTRELPGTGETDFKRGFEALKSIGYDGFMALECGVEGDPYLELSKAVEYLKSCM